MKRRPDVVYSLSWPIFASALLAAVARVRHIPIVSNVQDIYPESLVAQGRLSSEGFVFRLLRMTDQALMSRSRAVILISEQSKQSYISCRGLPSAKIAVIPNWGDSEAAAPDPLAGLELRKRMGIRDTDVLAVFAGNVGAAANVESVIEAMVEMDDPRLFLLIAGEGSSLAACEALAAKSAAARRIIFHHPWHISETSGILSSADLMLLPTRGRQSLVSTPSKLLAYMLVGKPVLATGFANSDLAEIIANAGCGWLIEPDNPSRLANMLRQLLAKSSDELKTRGHAGRLYVQQKLSKQACVPRIVELLQSCADASC
jgi:glycosyltransferase involved in cell wall biosynthesis